MKKWLFLARAFPLSSWAALTHKATAQEPVTLEGMHGDIRKILKNQETILEQLDEIQAELQIVKIRATR